MIETDIQERMSVLPGFDRRCNVLKNDLGMAAGDKSLHDAFVLQHVQREDKIIRIAFQGRSNKFGRLVR